MKKALIIGGLFVVVVVAVGYYLYTSLDSIIQAAIEKYGSAYTGTEVRVAGVNLDLTSGNGKITGLSVGNPDGFATDNAIEVGTIAISVDVNSITEDPIVIKEIAPAKAQPGKGKGH